MHEPTLGSGGARESIAFLRSQFRALASEIMETLPQVKTVTVGDGMAQDGVHGPTTTYHRHWYWCEPLWHTIAVESDYACNCGNRGETLYARTGEFLRWKYST